MAGRPGHSEAVGARRGAETLNNKVACCAVFADRFTGMETWIRRACRQRSYRTFVTWILLTIGVVAINIGARDYWANFFQGPYPLTEIESLHSPDTSREFVSVEGDKVVESGIREITTETKNGVKQREYASSNYYVMVIGKKLIAINSKQNPGLKANGNLKPLPSELPLMIFPEAADADLRNSFAPLMLDTTEDYRMSGYFALAAMALFAFLFWKFAVPAYRRVQDITLHPVVQRVERWADTVDVTMKAELEQSRSTRFKKFGSVVITDNFVIVRSLYSFDLLPFNHLLWAYKKVTTRRINLLPVAQTSSAELIFYGGSATFASRKKLVEEVLTYAASRAPWAIFGYTDELNSIYKKDPAGFISAVEKRKMQMEG